MRTTPASTPGWPPLSEQNSLRKVMALFATGVTIVTAAGENGHGMTANAFSSVSLDPPIVLCCVSRTARMHEAILATRSFAVSILGAEQSEVARYFTDRSRPQGPAQFEEIGCHPGPRTGAPMIEGALAWLECDLLEVHEGGDHSIFMGAVLSSARSGGSEALSFFDGEYHLVGLTGRHRPELNRP